MKTSVRIKLRDASGKELVETKVDGQIEKRFSRKPDNAIQIVLKNGKFVHLHCKAKDCSNEWKVKDRIDVSGKFEVSGNPSGVWRITCKRCGRTYFSG